MIRGSPKRKPLFFVACQKEKNEICVVVANLQKRHCKETSCLFSVHYWYNDITLDETKQPLIILYLQEKHIEKTVLQSKCKNRKTYRLWQNEF